MINIYLQASFQRKRMFVMFVKIFWDKVAQLTIIISDHAHEMKVSTRLSHTPAITQTKECIKYQKKAFGFISFYFQSQLISTSILIRLDRYINTDMNFDFLHGFIRVFGFFKTAIFYKVLLYSGLWFMMQRRPPEETLHHRPRGNMSWEEPP